MPLSSREYVNNYKLTVGIKEIENSSEKCGKKCSVTSLQWQTLCSFFFVPHHFPFPLAHPPLTGHCSIAQSFAPQ